MIVEMAATAFHAPPRFTNTRIIRYQNVSARCPSTARTSRSVA